LIAREEIQEIARRYGSPLGVVLGSHSALDSAAGLRDYGLRSLVYTTRQRASIYLREARVGRPGEVIEDLPYAVRRDLIVAEDIRDIVRRRPEPWVEAILVLDRYEDILKPENLQGLVELEGVQLPNRAFATYVGGEACAKVENDFPVPILGSRRLLKIENREEVEKNYYWYLERAGVPHPREFKYRVTKRGLRFLEKVEQPVVLKVPHAARRLERGFIFSADGPSLEEEVAGAVEAGQILHEDLKLGRAEEYVPGVTANFNFFYSPINAEESWGEVEKHVPRTRLANEFLSIDERRETTHDGILRMMAKEQLKADWSKTPYPLTFEVTAHGIISLRESLIRKIYPVADAFVDVAAEEEPPGMIGAYCVQTLITFQGLPMVEAVSQGIYDAGAGTVYDFVPKTQDIAVRHGGGANVHMGLGSQYANAKYGKPLSLGGRVALELKRATQKGKLDRIVT